MQLTNEQAERLVEQYGDLLLRVAWSWTGSAADAQDVCQTVLLRLLTAGKTFGSPEAERAWLIRVAVNECKNLHKSAFRRHRADLDEGLCVSAEDPEPEEGGLLEQVMALPQKYREVIFLRYYEGYGVKEIASLLGRSPALVSTHLKRAKEKLRIMLGGTEYA